MAEKKKPVNVYLTENQRNQLKEISDEIGMAQSTLILLSTLSFIENYKQKGSFVFADLLNPDYKK